MSWKHSINIKKYLNSDSDISPSEKLPESIRSGVLSELNKLNLDSNEYILEMYKQELRDEIVLVSEFNEWLDELYDFCDQERIWLGLQ